MTPLVAMGERPTARMCVIMAELEEREHNAQGLAREWLARASRAPRDPVWIADGHWSKQWAPVSPVTGKLDAYRWMQPKEEIAGADRGAAASLSGAAGDRGRAGARGARPAATEPRARADAGPRSARDQGEEPPAPAASEPAKAPPRPSSGPEPVIFPLRVAAGRSRRRRGKYRNAALSDRRLALDKP